MVRAPKAKVPKVVVLLRPLRLRELMEARKTKRLLHSQNQLPLLKLKCIKHYPLCLLNLNLTLDKMQLTSSVRHPRAA